MDKFNQSLQPSLYFTWKRFLLFALVGLVLGGIYLSLDFSHEANKFHDFLQPPPRENPNAYRILKRHHYYSSKKHQHQQKEKDGDDENDDVKKGKKGRVGEVYVISFVDDAKNSLGIMYGVASRSCYSAMHGYHHIFYSEKDLNGYVWPDDDGLPIREATDRALMWSKSILIKRTFEKFNLTDRDWVFWLDADTVITDPRVTVEEIVDNVTRYTITEGNEPHFIVANSNDGINAGIMMMRRTKWSENFLKRWWGSRFSTRTHLDNGAMYNPILEDLAASKGVKYKGECDMQINHGATTEWDGLRDCFLGYTRNTLCGGNFDKNGGCISRIAHSDKEYGSEWSNDHRGGAKPVAGKDFEYGFMTQRSDHIGFYYRMNDGFNWQPCAEWSEERSFLLHMAGTGGPQRNRKMPKYTRRFSHRYSPRCF